ncbi:hypothetical protein [Sphingobium sp. CCH11-B1]|jgi:hypothetical protein|uniref:hypothetical protein n=1 Tax=Sphingobium sp. CCH11-B1 TaxID=1768781 RepID=UPI00082F8187|nr:hypothetical protein [Sphingobium sp. CCH11-B1]MEA3389064.1 hypothetical protein [Pseudomonadota bacterium]
MRIALPIAFLAMLTGCGSGDQDGVGGVSAGDAKALNEAAARLDAEPRGSTDAGLNPAATGAARADRERRPPNDRPR